ncbi:MAG TPA: hypothetical protein VMV46_09035 [Thermoanaerobaculia bacterium]|nr:hypothetical protein [Thermoanaerobaculia bacterium]
MKVTQTIADFVGANLAAARMRIGGFGGAIRAAGSGVRRASE